jgi:hypothetical protein
MNDMNKVFCILMIVLGCFVLSGQTYQVGDIYTAPDGSKGIVYFIHPDGSGGWVVALNDISSGCAWGDATDVAGLENQNTSYYASLMIDTSGYANTKAIRLHQNNNNSYAAGKVNFVNGWCLPSPAQLRLLSAQGPRINSAIISAGGSALAAATYWTSAEYSHSEAWAYYFGPQNSLSGGANSMTKTTNNRVREVLSFMYDDNLNYVWNTGDTTPVITVSPSQTTTYSVTVTADDGSSGTAQHHIVVNNTYLQTFFDTICQGEAYSSNGFTLTAEETTAPGVLTRTRTVEENGCSSIYTLELQINSLKMVDILQTVCESYEWNGNTYQQSGDYTVHYTSHSGCDSSVTLHLRVTGVPEVSILSSTDNVNCGDSITLCAGVQNVSETVVPPAITVGDILCTDNTFVKPSSWPMVGKTAMAIVYYVDSTGEHGWAVHLRDLRVNDVSWGGYGTDIPTLNNYLVCREAHADMDGYHNTQKMLEQSNATGVYNISTLVSFEEGWYLPAAGQLNLLLSLIEYINSSLQMVGGDPFPLDATHYYWSSTEKDQNYAWDIYNTGLSGANQKYGGGSLRTIRSF